MRERSLRGPQLLGVGAVQPLPTLSRATRHCPAAHGQPGLSPRRELTPRCKGLLLSATTATPEKTQQREEQRGQVRAPLRDGEEAAQVLGREARRRPGPRAASLSGAETLVSGVLRATAQADARELDPH